MAFILNGSKMDSRPDNIQNSMIPLRGDYGTFSVQNFHISWFLSFSNIHLDCDTNQVTLNCLEGIVYICAYLWPLGLPIILFIIGLCVHFTHHVHHWVMCTFHVPHKILSLVNLESLLRYEVLFKLDTPIINQFIRPADSTV